MERDALEAVKIPVLTQNLAYTVLAANGNDLGVVEDVALGACGPGDLSQDRPKVPLRAEEDETRASEEFFSIAPGACSSVEGAPGS